MGRMLREKQRVGLKTPVLSVRCIVDSQQHLEDLLATEAYIKASRVGPVSAVGVSFYKSSIVCRVETESSPCFCDECPAQEELNACELQLSSDCSEVPLSLNLNFKALGPRVGREMQKLQAEAKKLTQEQLRTFEAEGQLELAGFVLSAEDAVLRRELAGASNPNIAVHGDK